MMAHPQEKYAIPSPEIVTPISTTDLKKKSYKTKAIVAIVLGVAVVAGVSLCIYFFTKTTADIYKHYHWKCKDAHGKLDQNVDNSIKENSTLYHIHNETNEQWVLLDFNKNIKVYKIQNIESTICFISPLNKTSELSPEDLDNEMEKNPPGTVEDEVLDEPVGRVARHYTAYSDMITDTSFLSPKAKDLCGSHDIYWIYPSCVNTEDKILPSIIRAMGCSWHCHTYYEEVCTGWFVFRTCDTVKTKRCHESCD